MHKILSSRQFPAKCKERLSFACISTVSSPINRLCRLDSGSVDKTVHRNGFLESRQMENCMGKMYRGRINTADRSFPAQIAGAHSPSTAFRKQQKSWLHYCSTHCLRYECERKKNSTYNLAFEVLEPYSQLKSADRNLKWNASKWVYVNKELQSRTSTSSIVKFHLCK